MNILQVSLWGKLAGDLLFDESQNQIYFRYNKEFLNSGLDIAPILMPLSGRTNIYSFPTLNRETFKELPPVFSDSLPDKFGNEILHQWLQQKGKSLDDLNPLERLSYVGKRGMGALEYLPPEQRISSDNKPIDVSEIVTIANEVLNHKADQKGYLNNMDSILTIGTSAGGARAKAIIAIDKNTNEVFAGDILHQNKDITYHLLKIEGGNDLENRQCYGRIEYAYYLMAKQSGIAMSKSELFEENGRAHFLTQRFDRVGGEKTHMTTLNSIANMDYNQPLIHSYEQCFNVLDKLNLPQNQVKEQFRRMVFNVVARNLDDHTKNISFLMNKQGKWSLSPAYDITYAYNPSNRWLKQHQMSVNGKRTEIKRKDISKLAPSLDIRSKRIIIDQVTQGISQWKKIAASLDIDKAKIEMIENNLIYNQINKQGKTQKRGL